MRLGIGVRVFGPISVYASFGGRRRRRYRRPSAVESILADLIGLIFYGSILIGVLIAFPALWWFVAAGVLVGISCFARKHMKDPPAPG